MTERKAFPLRIDPRVYEGMARWAADELRSINAQIEFVLRRALAEAGRLPKDGSGGPPGAPRQPNPGVRDSH